MKRSDKHAGSACSWLVLGHKAARMATVGPRLRTLSLLTNSFVLRDNHYAMCATVKSRADVSALLRLCSNSDGSNPTGGGGRPWFAAESRRRRIGLAVTGPPIVGELGQGPYPIEGETAAGTRSQPAAMQRASCVHVWRQAHAKSLHSSLGRGRKGAGHGSTPGSQAST